MDQNMAGMDAGAQLAPRSYRRVQNNFGTETSVAFRGVQGSECWG